MLYSTFISKLRTQVGDTARRVHVDWVGDGTTTVFQMPTDSFPVLESSFVAKLAGTEQGEDSQYTLNKETGLVTMITAPGNGVALTMDASAVYLIDATWLVIINDVISSLGDDFWKEFVDSTQVTTIGMLSLSLATAQPKCIALYDFWHRKSTGENWRTVDNYTNWRYDRDNNIIYLGDLSVFSVAGEPLKIRGLKTYTLGTAATDTIDVQDKFFTILEYGSIARYWRYRYKNVIELVSKITTEATRTPLQEIMMLSDRFDRLYENEKSKLKPQKPPRIIPNFKEGGGRP